MVYLCDQLICAVAFVNADTYWDEGRVHVHFVVCIPDLQLCLQRCCVLLIAYFPTFDMDNLFGSSCDDSCLSSHWGLIWVYNRYWVGTYEEMFLLHMGGGESLVVIKDWWGHWMELQNCANGYIHVFDVAVLYFSCSLVVILESWLWLLLRLCWRLRGAYCYSMVRYVVVLWWCVCKLICLQIQYPHVTRVFTFCLFLMCLRRNLQFY